VITKLDITSSYFYQVDICSGTVAFEPHWIGILDLAVDNDVNRCRWQIRFCLVSYLLELPQCAYKSGSFTCDDALCSDNSSARPASEAETSLHSGVGPLLGRTPIENALQNLVVDDLHSRRGALSCENVLSTIRGILEADSVRRSRGSVKKYWRWTPYSQWEWGAFMLWKRKIWLVRCYA
jgi:hypothetical protein